MLPPPERPKRGTKNSRVFCANFGTTRDLDLPRFGLPKSPVFSHGTQRDAIFPSNSADGRRRRQANTQASKPRAARLARRHLAKLALDGPISTKPEPAHRRSRLDIANKNEFGAALGLPTGQVGEGGGTGGTGTTAMFVSRSSSSCLKFRSVDRAANSRLNHLGLSPGTRKRKIGEH